MVWGFHCHLMDKAYLHHHHMCWCVTDKEYLHHLLNQMIYNTRRPYKLPMINHYFSRAGFTVNYDMAGWIVKRARRIE